jgi:uncharacterized protein (DUF1499 family)
MAMTIITAAILWIVLSCWQTAEGLIVCFPPLTVRTASPRGPSSPAARRLVLGRRLLLAAGVSRHHHHPPSWSNVDESSNTAVIFRNKRRRLFENFAMVASGCFWTNEKAACAEEAVADNPFTVSICEKPAGGAPPNCVSTASVRQYDLYAAPWTWYDDSLSTEAILARLKGAIAVEPNLTIVAQTSDGLVVTAQRNAFCVDQIIFRINAKDRAVTFTSRQIAGPESVSDFGANRKRLEQIRKATQVLQIMGSEYGSADSSSERREGVSDQLKAFWGLQSGGGYESVLLDEDDAVY